MSTRTRVITALSLVFTMLLAAFSTVQVSASGPVTGNKLDRIYMSAGATEAALGTGAIDMNDEPLSATSILAWVGNPAIAMKGYAAVDKFQVDMNNQWWPTGPNDPAHASPGPKNTFFNPSGVRDVAALHFRRAVAHLANKDMYVTTFMGGYAYVMQTEVPVPVLEGFTEYSTLANATAVADAGLGGYMYPYDRAAAISEFELGGFRDYDADTFREWRDPGGDGTYGTGDDGPIEELPNMKFIELSRGPWISIAPDLYNEMLSAGIPTASTANSNGLWYITAAEDSCFNVITFTYDYNFLVGGSWALGVDPDFIYNLYHSSMGQYSYALNYPGFKNAEFDSFAWKVKYPESLSDLQSAAVQAQWVKAKYVPVVELFSSKGVKAYRAGWENVINMAGYGTDNRYSFLLMNWVDGPGTSRSGPAFAVAYGLSFGPSDLHVITSGASWGELPVPQTAWSKLFGAKVLSQIYDSLIGRNPYNLASEVGWLASSWSVTSNYPGWQGLSVAEFTVRTDAVFHDGTPVKPADVAFSMLMTRDAGAGVAWNYPAVKDIDRVEIQGQIVRVFFNAQSALALHWVGFLPIINKDLWDDAIGAGTAAGYTGFIPDDMDGVYTGGAFTNYVAIRDYRPWESTFAGDPTKYDLAEDGSGPWEFVSYTIGNNVVLSGFTPFYTTVYYKGQAMPFMQFVYSAFHEIGDVNYAGSYGESQGWYQPPSTSWIFNPSSTEGQWINPTNAYSSNNYYATTNMNEAMQQYSSYGMDFLAGYTITGVELGIEAFASVSGASLSVSVSWDGGTNWAPEISVGLSTTDSGSVKWKDFTQATTWNINKLSAANFRARVKAVFGGTLGVISLDWIPMKIVFLGAPAGWANAKIDLFDLTTIATSAPSSSDWIWGPGNQQFNPDADVNHDGAVNVIDLATAGINYGKTMG